MSCARSIINLKSIIDGAGAMLAGMSRGLPGRLRRFDGIAPAASLALLPMPDWLFLDATAQALVSQIVSPVTR